jgi:hypothetical protein
MLLPPVSTGAADPGVWIQVRMPIGSSPRLHTIVSVWNPSVVEKLIFVR